MPELDIHLRTLSVAGHERSYWSPTRQPRTTDAPLLIALHGLGMTGLMMARWTGLAERAPELGFHIVFPDADERCWDDHGCGRRDEANDPLYITSLVDHLRARGEVSSEQPVFLTGISNGACFSERLARSATLPVCGIALVSGSARVASRRLTPQPLQSSPVLIVHGSADRASPWDGGKHRPAWRRYRANLRVRRALADTSGHESVGVPTVKADWEEANAGTDKQVVVHRIEGAGHGWPGGSGPFSSRIFGRPARKVDATGLVLEFARASFGR